MKKRQGALRPQRNSQLYKLRKYEASRPGKGWTATGESARCPRWWLVAGPVKLSKVKMIVNITKKGRRDCLNLRKGTLGHEGKIPYINERNNLLARAREWFFAAPGIYVSSSNGRREEN